MALNPISHTEITAWASGMNLELLPFERRAIRAIDQAYVAHCNSKNSEEKKDA